MWSSQKQRQNVTSNLIEHTASRLLEMNFDKIESVIDQEDASPYKGTLQCKWGFDGASGQSICKQKYQTLTDENMNYITEETLFLTSIVPLSLILNEQNIWTNQSPLLRRPIQLQYVKETPDILRSEKVYFQDKHHASWDHHASWKCN